MYQYWYYTLAAVNVVVDEALRH